MIWFFGKKAQSETFHHFQFGLEKDSCLTFIIDYGKLGFLRRNEDFVGFLQGHALGTSDELVKRCHNLRQSRGKLLLVQEIDVPRRHDAYQLGSHFAV